MHKLSRRQFVLTTAAATLTFRLRRVLGANDAINMGFIGLGGRGTESARWFSEIPGVRVVALADPDSAHLAKVQQKYPDAKGYADLRQLLDDKNINAVCISTCNHWHALATVLACQAGKDVYVEKPVSQTLWEGRKMVEAARKYNRIVQGGTQQRSDPVQEQIKEFIRSGKIGKMLWIRGNRLGVRAPIGKLDEPLKPPSTVNYDLWLGPAQDLPMYRKDFHYDWHWFWNTGSGEMGNWGVHILDDIANMLDDRCKLPSRILAGGGRIAYNDAGETPNVHFVYYDTGIVPVIFFLSNLPMKTGSTASPHYRNIRSGFVIQCENGYYAGGRGGGNAFDSAGKRIQQFKGDGGGRHARNFIEAVRSRDRSIQKGEIEQAHFTTAWCHLANIAFRSGVAYSKAQALSAAADFAPWQELMNGFEDHVRANGVEISTPELKVSSMLQLDAAKETFIGPSATPQNLAMLTREYRKPYVLPEQV